MADTVSPEKRSDVMRRVRSRNTTPEMTVRRALHKQGFRYRLHHAKLPGKPDLTLLKYKTVVFVNGCLWHWHGCKNSRMPHSNVDYWTKKIARNIERDKSHYDALQSHGWHVAVIWECAVEAGLKELLQSLRNSSE